MKNTRLTIENQVQPGGGYDDSPPEEWAQFAVEWFSITPASGRDYEQAQKMNVQVSHRAESVYLAGVCQEFLRCKLRLVGHDRQFNVSSVVNRDENNRMLDWLLVEVPTDG